MELNGFLIDKFNQYGIQENIRFSICPICSANRKPANQRQKCMSVFWESGLGQCNHCGERVQLHTYKSKKEEKQYVRPEWKNNTKLSDKVVKWFEGRGISQFTLRMAKVGEGKEWMPQTQKEENTVQFHYFRNSELINTKFRDGAKNFKLVKDAEKILYNLDSCHISESIIICEGEIDTLSFIEIGLHHSTSIPNGSTLKSVNLEYIDNCIEYFENKKIIYLALDSDEAGQNTTKELIRRFGAVKCRLVDFNDCKDANEYLVRYGKDELKNVIENAKEVPIEGVSSLYDWKENFEEYLLNGFNQGYKIGNKSFDSIFSTYTGQYIVVTGVPSSGKSDFVDQMCLGYNQQYGWKIAIASTENKPNEIHASKIIAKIAGEWVCKKEQLSQIWYKKSIDYMNDTFKYIDMNNGFDLDGVLEKAEQLIFRFGIKCLVIDPFNKIRLKESINKDTNKYTNDYLIKIDEFARKHDILIILVAHPVKQDREGGYEPQSFYDIKGGGEFYDMSPHGILVHRDYEHDCTKIKIFKVKFAHLGKNNKHIYLKWNENNGRYMDYSTQHENPENLSGLIIDNSNYMIEKEKNIKQVEFDINKNIEPNRNFENESSIKIEKENDLPF